MSGNMEEPTLRIISLTDQHGTTFTAICEAAWSAIDREGRTIVLTLHEAVCSSCGESMQVGHQCTVVAQPPVSLHPSKKAIRRAWDFCKNVHHWDNPCPECQSLAEAFDSFAAQSRKI